MVKMPIRTLCLSLCLFFLLNTSVFASIEKEVAKTYREWCSAIAVAKGNSQHIKKFYDPAHAILLATFSSKILHSNEQGFSDYFVTFTSRPNIKCSTNILITQVYDNIAVNTGFYTFTYTEKDNKIKIIPARFTFVYKKYHNKWLIINHHSSVVPNIVI